MSTKTKKNIIFYCSSISWGGLEMNTVRYAAWMRDCGYNVKLLCVASSPIHLKSKDFQIDVTLVTRNRKYFDLVNAFKIAKIIDDLNADVVWFRDTRDMSLLSWVKKIASRKFKLLYFQAMQLGVEKKDFFHTARFAAIDFWISTLDFLKHQVLEKTKVREQSIHVIPIGVDQTLLEKNLVEKKEAKRQLGLDINKTTIAIIGRIDPLKGQHILINAAQLLHRDDFEILIVGESTRNESNRYEVELKQKIRSLGMQGTIFFKPYSDNVALYYSATDIFVMASKGETFGTVTIEAMSFGIPVIGTNSSGTPELLDYGKSGLLFEPDNAEELSQKLRLLLDESSLREEIGAKGKRRFLSCYSKQASIDAFINLIEKN
ncbi:MAG: glycosyltransferase family 4 protein [Flavobacteriales bacterium]|jgi:glycosyltransferase involved in cell wall biosynthesis